MFWQQRWIALLGLRLGLALSAEEEVWWQPGPGVSWDVSWVMSRAIVFICLVDALWTAFFCKIAESPHATEIQLEGWAWY